VRHLRIFGAWHKHRYNIAASMPASCSGHGKTVELGAVLVERCVPNNFATELGKGLWTNRHRSCNTKVKLVEAKLEMVRAAGLFHCDAAVSRVHWINTSDRRQRD
jgi:hypothetical protein